MLRTATSNAGRPCFISNEFYFKINVDLNMLRTATSNAGRPCLYLMSFIYK